MPTPQPGILAPLPAHARYLTFRQRPDVDPVPALRAFARLVDGDVVVGFGASLVRSLGRTVEGLRPFGAQSGPGFDVPATDGAIWCWLRGDDRGALVLRGRALEHALSGGFEVASAIDAFVHAGGRDLSGYEDGTENPTGDEAVEAAFVASGGPLEGSSFVAVQQWVHDFARFDAMGEGDRDHMIGRRRSDNEELDDAPPSAHVKRTAQESFAPEAFVLRRSMPWVEGARAGLVFVAFGRSFDAFEAQLRRMVGAEDGVADALFRFTRPVTGAHFWCPPLREGQLDLGALGL